MKSLLIFFVCVSSVAKAASGADVLLDNLGEKPVSTVPAPAEQVKHNTSSKADAFQQQFAIATEAAELSPKAQEWADQILAGDFAKAALGAAKNQKRVPASFRYQAQAAANYALWRLSLNQTFFDQWLESLKDPLYAKSHAEASLEIIITPKFDEWLLEHPIELSARQKQSLATLATTRPFLKTLRAWIQLRDMNAAPKTLKTLPPGNHLIPYLVDTAVFALLKSGDIKTAAKTLKASEEPTIFKNQDLELLAAHDLSIARILYQAGQYAPAAEFYKKIPNQLPQFIEAQEELSWAYLRLNDMTKLRGTLEALANPVFKDRFQPEVYLLRAISDLKVCLYDNVEQDLKDFAANNAGWAKRIDQALKANPPRPASVDTYTAMAEQRQRSLKNELAETTRLGMPKKNLPTQIAEAQKETAREYSRQWRARSKDLAEAIRKMRFVKIEYLSQLRTLALSHPLISKNKVAASGDSLPRGTKLEGESMSFPTTPNEIWPDELFKLRSVAETRCLQKAGRK